VMSKVCSIIGRLRCTHIVLAWRKIAASPGPSQ
jgi:hypothetical protein